MEMPPSSGYHGCHADTSRRGPRRGIDEPSESLRVGKWRATADEDGQYSFAVAL